MQKYNKELRDELESMEKRLAQVPAFSTFSFPFSYFLHFAPSLNLRLFE
jgi:hypothetical protein